MKFKKVEIMENCLYTEADFHGRTVYFRGELMMFGYNSSYGDALCTFNNLVVFTTNGVFGTRKILDVFHGNEFVYRSKRDYDKYGRFIKEAISLLLPTSLEARSESRTRGTIVCSGWAANIEYDYRLETGGVIEIGAWTKDDLLLYSISSNNCTINPNREKAFAEILRCHGVDNAEDSANAIVADRWRDATNQAIATS